MIHLINIQYTMDSITLKNYQISDVTLLLCVCVGVMSQTSVALSEGHRRAPSPEY